MSLGSGYAVRDLGVADEVDIYAFDSNVVSVGMAYRLINDLPLSSDHIDTTTTYVSASNMYDTNIQRMVFRFEG